MLLVFGVILLLPVVVLLLAGVGAGINLFLAQQVAGLIAITASVFIARRLLDRRSVRSLGLWTDRRAAVDLLAGFLIAAAMMAVIFLIEQVAGWLTNARFAWRDSGMLVGVLSMLMVFIAVGWQEELFARGYLLNNLAEGLNLPLGVLLSSLVFALAHLSNPNVQPVAILGLLLAGIFLAYAYLRTRQLWLPIGLHIGWNFFEGTVFGFPVSGLGGVHLIQHRVVGPELFTGGAFGPKAGLVLLPALAIGAGMVWLFTCRRYSSLEPTV
jgi:membrane protease YdiL (CAAX protease family)